MNEINNNTYYRVGEPKGFWKKIDPNDTMSEYTKLVNLIDQFDKKFMELGGYNFTEESGVMSMKSYMPSYQDNLLKLYSLKEKMKYLIDDTDFSNLESMIKEAKFILRDIEKFENLDKQRIEDHYNFAKSKEDLKKLASDLRRQLQKFKLLKKDGLFWNDEIFNEIKNNSVFKELQNLLASDFSARVKLIENNYELVEKLGNSFLEKYDRRVKNPFFKQDIYNLEFLKKTTPLIDYNSDNFGEVYELLEKERWYYMSDICTMYEFKVLKKLFDLEIINSKYNSDKILEVQEETIDFPCGLLLENDLDAEDFLWSIEIESQNFNNIDVNGNKCETVPVLFSDYVREKFPKYAEKYDRKVAIAKNKHKIKSKK